MSDAQRFDELRIEVLRQELRAAHCRGDVLTFKPCARRYSGELPGAVTSSRSRSEMPGLQLSLDTDNTESEALQSLKLGFGFAKDAVDAGFAALGSFWSNAAVRDEVDSDEGAFKTTLRARSEGARVRESSAAPALKKMNSRRSSRGGAPLRVSFVSSDDEGPQKNCQPEMERFSFAVQCEEQEPMGEPEPLSIVQSPQLHVVDSGQVRPTEMLDQPVRIPPQAIQSVLSDSGQDRRIAYDSTNDTVNQHIDTSRREMRMSLDVTVDEPLAVHGCATQLSGPASRRARLRGRLHGYSICDGAGVQSGTT